MMHLRHLHLPNISPHYISYDIALRVQQLVRRQHLDYKKLAAEWKDKSEAEVEAYSAKNKVKKPDKEATLKDRLAYPPPPTLISFTLHPTFFVYRPKASPIDNGSSTRPDQPDTSADTASLGTPQHTEVAEADVEQDQESDITNSADVSEDVDLEESLEGKEDAEAGNEEDADVNNQANVELEGAGGAEPLNDFDPLKMRLRLKWPAVPPPLRHKEDELEKFQDKLADWTYTPDVLAVDFPRDQRYSGPGQLVMWAVFDAALLHRRVQKAFAQKAQPAADESQGNSNPTEEQRIWYKTLMQDTTKSMLELGFGIKSFDTSSTIKDGVWLRGNRTKPVRCIATTDADVENDITKFGLMINLADPLDDGVPVEDSWPNSPYLYEKREHYQAATGQMVKPENPWERLAPLGIEGTEVTSIRAESNWMNPETPQHICFRVFNPLQHNTSGWSETSKKPYVFTFEKMNLGKTKTTMAVPFGTDSWRPAVLWADNFKRRLALSETIEHLSLFPNKSKNPWWIVEPPPSVLPLDTHIPDNPRRLQLQPRSQFCKPKSNMISREKRSLEMTFDDFVQTADKSAEGVWPTTMIVNWHQMRHDVQRVLQSSISGLKWDFRNKSGKWLKAAEEEGFLIRPASRVSSASHGSEKRSYNPRFNSTRQHSSNRQYNNNRSQSSPFYQQRDDRGSYRPRSSYGQDDESTYSPRKSYTPRGQHGESTYSPRKSYTPRGQHGESSYSQRKPYTPRGQDGDSSSYTPRKPSTPLDRDSNSSSYSPRRSYTPRGQDGENSYTTRKPYVSRGQDGDSSSYKPRKPYMPRDRDGDSSSYTPRKPYMPHDRDGDSSSYTPRKPYTPREQNGHDGYTSRRPYTLHEQDGDRSYKPRAPDSRLSAVMKGVDQASDSSGDSMEHNFRAFDEARNPRSQRSSREGQIYNNGRGSSRGTPSYGGDRGGHNKPQTPYTPRGQTGGGDYTPRKPYNSSF